MDRNRWLFIGGMACYWPTFRNSFFGLVFTEGQGGYVHFDMDYLALLGFMAVLGSACLLHPDPLERLLRGDRRVVPALSLVASLGLALVYGAHLLELPAIFALVGIVCAAVGFLVLTYAWFQACVETDESSMLFNLSLSFFLSFLLSLVSLLPTPASLALPFLAWIGSGTAWCCYRPAIGNRSAADGHGSLRGVMSGFVVLLVAFLIIGAIMRGFLYSGTVAYSPEQGSYARRALSLALSFALVVIAYRADSGKPSLFGLWVGVAVVFFGGLFLVGSLYPIMPEVASGVVVSGRTFVTFFLWVALILVIRKKQTPLIPAVSMAFVLVECVSGFCSYFVVPMAVRAIRLPVEAYLPSFALLMAFVLVVSTLVFLALAAGRRPGGDVWGFTGADQLLPNEILEKAPAASAKAERSRLEACRSLGARHGLTEREVDVMRGFSEGNSLKKVADSLFISVSTAQTHVKSLYRKLGIHSKQELIDTVADEMRRP